MRIAASIALNDESSVTHSVRYVGIELLGQFKMKKGIFIFSWRENAALVLGESSGNSSPRRESFSCSAR